MKIEIQRLNLADLEPFYTFFSKNINTTFPEYSEKLKEFMLNSEQAWNKENYRNKLTKQNRYIVGAFIEDMLVGSIEYTTPEFGVSFCVWLMVDSEYQRKGIGKKLIEHWEKEMKDIGVHFIYLNADDRNKDFYTKVGFTNNGKFEKAWFGLDSLFFSKQIQEPNEKVFLK